VKKLRVGIIYGGRSGEHEVSVASAASIIRHLDPERYESVPIFIERNGRWHIPNEGPTSTSAAEVLQKAEPQRVQNSSQDRETHFVAYPSKETILSIERLPVTNDQKLAANAIVTGEDLDVIFPVLHGPYGEDGTVQGLLELANIPYIGAGVAGSAVGMDKVITKKLFQASNLPIVKYVFISRNEWEQTPEAVKTKICKELQFPVFVKPANLGSSVGISKVQAIDKLAAAVSIASDFDRKIVIEEAVSEAREIECAVLGNEDPVASIPGEIIPSREFYDYEAKYLDTGSRLLIPAPLTKTQTETVQQLSVQAFRALECAGMARVDFLLDEHRKKIFLNEVNTIPGFTTVSMYPRLWEASGVSYSTLLDRLINFSLERYQEKQKLRINDLL
jgi:D-alanine-D-alanine ligase